MPSATYHEANVLTRQAYLTTVPVPKPTFMAIAGPYIQKASHITDLRSEHTTPVQLS